MPATVRYRAAEAVRETRREAAGTDVPRTREQDVLRVRREEARARERDAPRATAQGPCLRRILTDR